MKSKLYSFIILFFTLVPARAQVITEKHLDFSGKDFTNLDIEIADSINLIMWSKNEIFVTASVNINNNKDNDAYVISFDETGKSITISGKFKEQYFKGRDCCCDETDIFWQIFLPEKSDFKIETINGNITIAGATEEIHAKSISGFIDLAVPRDHKADLNISTITGTVYTDHEISADRRYSGIPAVITESLNDGGPQVTLETISGDIFFRKSY
ncbi:MAG: hypothetical protein V1903_04645 [Bacteroidota bacterium]